MAVSWCGLHSGALIALMKEELDHCVGDFDPVLL